MEEETAAVIVNVRDNYATLWNSKYGRISCRTKDLVDERGGSIVRPKTTVVPGAEAYFRPSKEPTGDDGCEGKGLRAERVRLTGRRSSWVEVGLGTITRTDPSGHFGFIDSDDFSDRVYAPDFAVSSGEVSVELEALEATRVHFLAIPNPKAQHSSAWYAIALHPFGKECGVEMGPEHWDPLINRFTDFTHLPDTRNAITILPAPPNRTAINRAYEMLLSPADEASPTNAFPTATKTPTKTRPTQLPPLLLRKTAIASATKGFKSWRKEGELVVEDGFFTYTKGHYGYLSSPSHGSIFYKQSDLDHTPSRPIPGTLARLHCSRSKCFGAGAMDAPELKATAIHYDDRTAVWAPTISSGFGRFREIHHTWGFLCSETEKRIFVPGWAGTNGSNRGPQIPELQGQLLHFLAMPNPKPRFHGGPFAIAVHAHDPDCSGPDADQPSHWRNRIHHEKAAAALTNDDVEEEVLLIDFSTECCPDNTQQTDSAKESSSSEPSGTLELEEAREVVERARSELSPALFVELVRACPNLVVWTHFRPSDFTPPALALETESRTLRTLTL